ncbi:MAG: DUF929 family protein [Conexivisphaerales archaeon]
MKLKLYETIIFTLTVTFLVFLFYQGPRSMPNHLFYSVYPSNSSAHYFQGQTGVLANSTVMNDLLNTYSQFVSVGEYISNFSVVSLLSGGQRIYILNISPYYVLIPYKIESKMPSLTQNGKSTFAYIGAQGCPFCAVQRVAMILALSRFGNFSKLFLDRSTTIDGNIPTYTFNFSQTLFDQYVVNKSATNNAPYGDVHPEPFFTGAYYTSPYIQLVPIDEIGGSYLINYSGIAQASPLIYNDILVASGIANNEKNPFGIQGFQFGGVPFFDINNQFVFDGAIVDINAIASQVENGSRMALLQSIQNPTIGSYGFIELASANVLAADICYTINNAASICKLPYMQRLEAKVTNLSAPFELSVPSYLIYALVGVAVAVVVVFLTFVLYRNYKSTKKELEEIKKKLSSETESEHKEEHK